jgi:hypothetical protein
VVDLTGQELEEPLQLVGIAPQRGRKLGGVEILRGLETPNLELEPVTEAVDPPEDAHCIPLGESGVEELDVAPDASLDASAGVDELEREVRRTGASAQALLLRDGVHTLDDPVVLELGNGRHASESRARNGRPARDVPVVRLPRFA